MDRLKGKVAIVTGAAMGIGRATALAMAAEGAAVAVADVNDQAGSEVAARIEAAGGAALFVHTDTGSSAGVARLVEAAVARFGRLDITFNNAGVAISGTAADMSEEDWNRVLNINLGGVWRGMKYSIPHMLAGGGS